jgi:uncharacterized protein with von Willebrand factor type A (vWA) domain
MFLDFFLMLRKEGIPTTTKEYLDLLAVLEKNMIHTVDDFYYLCRSVLIKHEQFLDRFDVLFGKYFNGAKIFSDISEKEIPEDWLKKEFDRLFSEEEKALIEAMGGLDKLMDRLKQLMEEQKEKHAGGNKWIGTGGTSPFGHGGYNPEGIRIGGKGGQGTAVKVWEKRNFKDYAGDVELNTRNIKMALRRLRIFAREGIPEEIDINTTIQKTSKNGGYLDIEMIPSRKNKVKVLLFFDIGGSMDPHVEVCEQLFSSAKSEFKHLEYFYFHNCVYESVWRNNAMRWDEKVPTLDILHKYNSDYRVIIVGDATMSPYEITTIGGSIEHYNDEAGATWIKRLTDKYPYLVWINPTIKDYWEGTYSLEIVQELVQNRMYPMTLEGLTEAMQVLRGKKTPPKIKTLI